MKQLQVEEFWVQDRSQLVVCYERHQALVDFYTHRDHLVSGAQ